MQNFDSDIRLSCELAFSAQRIGANARTDIIYDMLIEIKPDNACGYIGHALIALSQNKKDEAISMLKDNEHKWVGAKDEAVAICQIIENEL